MRASRSIGIFLLLVASLAVIAGCGSSGGTGGRLEGINWVLKSYDSNGTISNAPAAVSIDALFENGKVSGFSGVNTYQGAYKLSGSSLSIGKLASTLMAGPQDLMDAEQAYLAALQKTESYSANAGDLTLFDKAGKQLIEYSKGEAPSLTQGSWNTISYYDGGSAVVSVINGTKPTAVFAPDGAVTGSTGANDFRSTYKVDGQRITITRPELITYSTNPDPAVMQQEQNYLAALQLAARYEVKGKRLDLLRAEGGYAVTFDQAGEPGKQE